MEECRFINDNNISLFLSDSDFDKIFKNRVIAEPNFRRIINILLQNGYIDKNKNFIDAGSWIGDNALPWSKMIDGIVYAIDPSEENCKSAFEIANLNNINNVIFTVGALARERKKLYTDDDLFHCSFVGKASGSHEVEAFSIDDLYSENKINNITFIHLDVEGFELDAILGSEKTIEDFRPVISYEQHLKTDPVNEINLFLKNKNYKVFIIDESLAGCRPDCRNLLAIPLEKYNENLLNIIGNKNLLVPLS
jgi:FkbM family methyltransferase